MTAPQFTPPPWDLGPYELSRRSIITPSGEFMRARVIAHVFGGNIADDHLIAAAPELYAAVEALMSADIVDATSEVLEQASAALRKARGRP